MAFFDPVNFIINLIDQIQGIVNNVIGTVKIPPTFISSIQSTMGTITGLFSKMKLTSFFALFLTLTGCFVKFFKFIFKLLGWIILSLIPWLIYNPWPPNLFSNGNRYDKFIEAAFLPWIIRYIIVLSTRVANFPKCFIWYIIDIATWTIYLPFRFIFWLIDYFLDIGIVKGEHKVWNFLNDIDYYIHGPVRNYFLDQYVTMYIGNKMYKDGEIVDNPNEKELDNKSGADKIKFEFFKYKDIKNRNKHIDIEKEKDVNKDNVDKTITNDSASMNLGFHIFHFPNTVMEICYSVTNYKLADLDPFPMDEFTSILKCLTTPF